MEKKTKYAMTVIAGTILLLLGFFYTAAEMAGKEISLIFITAGATMIIVAMFRYNKLGAGVIQDERTRQISMKGISYSWFVTFLTLNILIWVEYLQLAELTLFQGLGIMLFVMIISANVYKYIFGKRGVKYED